MRLRNIINRGALLLALFHAGLALALQTGGEQPADGGDWGLEALMADLAQRRSGEARFTEIKTLTSLKQPLVAEGVLRFRYPDSMEKEILKPRAERFLIGGDSMEAYRDGKLRRQVSLASYPELQNFVRAFMATAVGDLEALRKYYDLGLEGSRANWTLHLTPVDAELRRIVKQITVQGAGSDIQSFETIQPNDDRSLMLITPQG
jgi:hypothetical protein